MTNIRWKGASEVQGRKCIVAGLFSAKEENLDSFILESTETIERYGGKVVGTVLQRRGVSRANRPGGSKNMNAPMNAATFIGQGKAHELKDLAIFESAEVIVFLNKLSGTQKRNLLELTSCNIIELEIT